MSLLNKASLIQIPSGYKDGTLYSAKPTNGDGDFTFSRGSNLAATRVNSEGLIEKGRENLVLQSNTFDTTWSTVNASVTGGQSGYDGTSDAWELNRTSVGGRIEQNVSLSGIKVFSLYAKSGTTDGVVLRVIDGVTDPLIFWSLLDGSYQGSGGGGGINPSTQAVENVGNGWYRFQITTSTTINQVAIYVANSSGAFANGTIYIQDAQLEVGLVATPYIETGASTAQAGILEDMPRLDYSGGATCPSLLLEPSRTNAWGKSEYFDLSPILSTASSATITYNAEISPEGVQNAAEFESVGGTSRLQTPYFSNNGDLVVTIFAKAGTGTQARINSYDGTADRSATYDLSDGSVSNVATDVTASTEAMSNGWYRLIYHRTNLAGVTNVQVFNTGGTFYIYGLQVEKDVSYPTSYIPTYGASVTRSQDKCYKAGIADLIGNNTTVFVDFIAQDQDAYCDIVAIDGGATSEIIELQQSSSNGLNAILYRSGFVANIPATSSLITGTRYKAAFRIKTNDFAFYLNGVLQGTDTSGTYNGDSVRLNFSGYAASTYNSENAEVSSCLLFNTALSNEELASLTTI